MNLTPSLSMVDGWTLKSGKKSEQFSKLGKNSFLAASKKNVSFTVFFLQQLPVQYENLLKHLQ